VISKVEDFLNDVIDVHRHRTPTRFADYVIENTTQFLQLIGAIWAEHL